jgi:hypothetical protein
MDEQQLFEIAAKLHNLRPDQLRLKKRYLDVVVIETLDGAKYTYFVADLEAILRQAQDAAEPSAEEITRLLKTEAETATGPAAKPQHTRKR